MCLLCVCLFVYLCGAGYYFMPNAMANLQAQQNAAAAVAAASAQGLYDNWSHLHLWVHAASKFVKWVQKHLGGGGKLIVNCLNCSGMLKKLQQAVTFTYVHSWERDYSQLAVQDSR